MKHLYLLLVFSIFSILATAQTVQVPQAVASSFTNKYPMAARVNWLQDDDGSFAARFYQRGEPCTVRFTPDGKWLDGVRKMTFGDLRNNVRDAFSQSPFGRWQAYEVNEIQRADKEPQYRIHIKHAESQTEKFLLYDTKGRLMKETGI